MKFFNRFKMGRDGTIRTKEKEGDVWTTYQDKPSLLCFVTPSLKEILKIFGNQILELRGSGEKRIEIKENIIDGGFNFCKSKKNSCFFHYKKSKHGELDKIIVNQVLRLLDKYNLEDCSVDYLKLKIEDEHLKKIINDYFQDKIGFTVLSKVFIAEFKLVKCESEIDKDKWEDTPYNRDVLAQNGFKRSTLHLIRLIDDGQVYNLRKKSKRFYYINWEPSNKSVKIEQLKSPIEIVSALKPNLNPYGYIKTYKLNNQKKLELVSMK